MSGYDPHQLMKLVTGMLLARIEPRGGQQIGMKIEDIEAVVLEGVVVLETLDNILQKIIRIIIIALETLDNILQKIIRTIIIALETLD
jgi:hypothetical protein